MTKFTVQEEARIDDLFNRIHAGTDNAEVVAGHGYAGVTAMKIGSVCLRTNTGNLAEIVGFEAEGCATDPEFTGWLANIPWPATGARLYRGIYLQRHATGLLVAKCTFDINQEPGAELANRYSYWLHMVRPATSGVIHARYEGGVTLSTDSELRPQIREEGAETRFPVGSFPSIVTPDEIFYLGTSARESGSIIAP